MTYATLITIPPNQITRTQEYDSTKTRYCGLPPEMVLQRLIPNMQVGNYLGVPIEGSGVHIVQIPGGMGLNNSLIKLANARIFREYQRNKTGEEKLDLAQKIKHQLSSRQSHKEVKVYQDILSSLGHKMSAEDITDLMKQDPLELPGGVISTY